MFRIGNLLRRLQNEASAGSTESKPIVIAPSKVQNESSATIESHSVVESPTVPLKEPSSKEKRHLLRRQRQRENKQLGQPEVVNLEPISSNGEQTTSSSDHGDQGEPTSLQPQEKIAFSGSLSTTVSFKISESRSNEGIFFKSAKWSPTGDRIATCSEEKGSIKVFHYPSDLSPGSVLELPDSSSIEVCSTECIYDYAWYPFSNAQYENSSLIATTARSRSIQLWDATNGSLRASYEAYDHLEALCAPNSISFSSDGSRLVGGFDGCLRVFSIDTPGDNYFEYWTKDTIDGGRSKNRSKRTVGLDGDVSQSYGDYSSHHLSGIISSISMPARNPAIMGCATFTGNLGIFDAYACNQVMSIDTGRNGITQILFSPCTTFVYCGFRRSNSISCYDLRMPDDELWSVERRCNTNQKIGFDIDESGSILLSGSTDGVLRCWNIGASSSPTEIPMPGIDDYPHDGINCVQFRPYSPSEYLLTTGKRQIFPDLSFCSDSEDSDSETRQEASSQLIVSYFDKTDSR